MCFWKSPIAGRVGITGHDDSGIRGRERCYHLTTFFRSVASQPAPPPYRDPAGLRRDWEHSLGKDQTNSNPFTNHIPYTCTRLFDECPVFPSVWYAICKWIGVSSVLHHKGTKVRVLINLKGLIGGGRVFEQRAQVVWFTCIWVIWKARNEKYFQNNEVWKILRMR